MTFGLASTDRPCGCPGPLRLRRTRWRKIVSIAYGRIDAVEEIGFCPAHPALPTVRSPELTRLVKNGGNYAYDLMARIGRAHYVECRQYEEIQVDLATRFDLDVPVRTVGHLAREFVAYVEVVHHEAAPLLRRDMARRGGYILHVDGTCEEGSRVLLVCMDSVSGQVLDSKKIGSENTPEVKGVLGKVRDEWGTPLAVVTDLRQSLLTAVGEVFSEVPQFVCHFHLAADVGKDILGPGVDRLRRLFRLVKLRPKLGVVARSLREFALGAKGAHVLLTLLEGAARPGDMQPLPEETGLGVVHGLVSWILAFSRAGEGYGFPFDVSYLALFERIVAANDLLAQVQSGVWSRDGRVSGQITRVRRILATVLEGEQSPEFSRVVKELRRDRQVFEAFRDRLRICPRGGKGRRNDEGEPTILDAERHRTILSNFKLSLETRSRWKSTAARACRIVVTHLDKYWPYLFGHRLEGAHGIVAPRTNNRAEQEFRKVKHGCRRLHGRGHLRRDVDEMPAGTMLLQNLGHPEYLATVYGGYEESDMAERFSKVDPAMPAKVVKGWKKDRATSRLPRKLERMDTLPCQLLSWLREACRSPEN